MVSPPQSPIGTITEARLYHYILYFMLTSLIFGPNSISFDIHFVLLYLLGTHLSVEGVLHLATVEYLDITNIKSQYQSGSFEQWKLAPPMKRARSGFALFNTPNSGVLTAIGGWPLTKDNITVEQNKNVMNGSKWLAVDTCNCLR